MLSGKLAVLQAAMLDGLSLDPFALIDDSFCPAEVGVGGRHVAEVFPIKFYLAHLKVLIVSWPI